MIQHISAVIITKNAARTLANTLDSLKSFSDVVVYNNGSNDDTALIAKRYPNVNLIEGEFQGFGQTKNTAASYAKNDWVLNLDADEVLDERLIQSIESLSPQNQTVYAVIRKNYYRSHEMRCVESRCRLYHRRETSFNTHLVHESITVPKQTKIVTLDGFLMHYSFLSASAMLKKHILYAELYASQHRYKKPASLSKAILKGIFSFARNMIVKLGILDGKAGFITHWTNANYTFYKYVFLAEYNRDISLSLILDQPNEGQLDRLLQRLSHIPKHITLKNIVQICPEGVDLPKQTGKVIEYGIDSHQAKQQASGDVVLVLRNGFIPTEQTLKDLDRAYFIGTCYHLNQDCFVAFKEDLNDDLTLPASLKQVPLKD